MKIPREKFISIKIFMYAESPLTGHFAVVKNSSVRSFSEVSNHTLASTSSEGLDQDSLSTCATPVTCWSDLPNASEWSAAANSNAAIPSCARTQARKAEQSKTCLQLEQDIVEVSQLSIENEKLNRVKICWTVLNYCESLFRTGSFLSLSLLNRTVSENIFVYANWTSFSYLN